MSSSFSPTQAELSLVTQIFNQYDTNKLGVLTGDLAVHVFEGAKLPPATLGEIWSIADESNNGWLSKKGAAIALRLIGWVQKGEKASPDLISKPGPLAVIEGVSSVATHNTGVSIPKSSPPMPALPPFTTQDKAKFQNMFVKAGPVDGVLSGEQARDIFVKSKLPNEKLLQIWNLADTQDRGFLDSTDFAIGMYFIQGAMSGQIPVIPNSLPPGLYQQASGGAGVRTHPTGGSYSPAANQTTFPQNRGYVQPQYTGQSVLQPQMTGLAAQKKPPSAPSLPARRVNSNPSQVGTSAFGLTNGAAQLWDVTAAEKASSDGYFDTLDTGKVGYIEGEVAVPFMLESKLHGEVLAQIWDLADLNNDGRLNRDGFAVAMHLIQKKLAGGEIPAVLPPSLIPPSMRNKGASAIGASAFSPVSQPTAPSEPQKDLFSFDETPPASATAPPPSGPFFIPAQQTGAQSSTFTSSFASPSVFASPAPPQDPFASSASKDLLGDDDDTGTASPPLHDKSAEIGNTQNQLNSTNRSLETAKNERASVEQSLANQAAQLSALQTQLSSAKAAYETETKLLSTLRERYTTQTAEIEKTRQELISAESDLSALRVEKAEIEGAFLRDKEEARELHRKMVEAGQQAEVLKAETEKAKKEAKQQKGLLAIAKKQLSSKEAEKAKAEKELAEANAEVAAATQEKEEAEVELENIMSVPLPVATMPVERAMSADSLTFAASQALPTTPDPASPSSIAGKSNNPFERLAKSSNPSTPRSQSPFLPFANAAVPSPLIASGNAEKPSIEASLDDPFGFSQAFETPAPAASTESPAPAEEHTTSQVNVETPKVPPTSPFNESVSSAIESSFSPTSTNEDFATPPMTASGQSETVSPSPARQTTAEIVSAKFPDLDAIPAPEAASPAATEGKMPGHFGEPSEDQHETDLGTSLKEIEEDDSDSSEDEDEIPLGELKAKATDNAHPKTDTAAAPLTNGTATKAAEPAFDDVFDVSPPAAAPEHTETTDAFGMPIKSAQDLFGNSTVSTEAKPAEAGMNAFDEALGKISGPGASAAPSATPQFTFDSAFDDNFDFSAASVPDNSFPPAPKANGPATGANTLDGFESLFTSQPNGNSLASSPVGRPVSAFLPNVVPSQPTPASAPAPAPAPAPGPSFDEVFAGFGSGPSIELETPAKASAPQAAPAESPTQKTFPSVSTPPASQTGSPSRSSLGRSMSPPPRVSSPKLRPSTASSMKDSIEKKEPPAARHSKLSIRLPFGKKKKQEQHPPPPPPAQFLTPPIEEPSRAGSPAVEDDVEAVKQLTAMGFSRSQAVNALENHSYDVPRALNSLLSQQ